MSAKLLEYSDVGLILRKHAGGIGYCDTDGRPVA